MSKRRKEEGTGEMLEEEEDNEPENYIVPSRRYRWYQIGGIYINIFSTKIGRKGVKTLFWNACHSYNKHSFDFIERLMQLNEVTCHR